LRLQGEGSLLPFLEQPVGFGNRAYLFLFINNKYVIFNEITK